jgi:hypothetical protein
LLRGLSTSVAGEPPCLNNMLDIVRSLKEK